MTGLMISLLVVILYGVFVKVSISRKPKQEESEYFSNAKFKNINKKRYSPSNTLANRVSSVSSRDSFDGFGGFDE